MIIAWQERVQNQSATSTFSMLRSPTTTVTKDPCLQPLPNYRQRNTHHWASCDIWNAMPNGLWREHSVLRGFCLNSDPGWGAGRSCLSLKLGGWCGTLRLLGVHRSIGRHDCRSVLYAILPVRVNLSVLDHNYIPVHWSIPILPRGIVEREIDDFSYRRCGWLQTITSQNHSCVPMAQARLPLCMDPSM